jgi:hypothetical protein
MSIKNNTTSLQNLLNAVNALPEAGGELPKLTNPGTADTLLLNKQLIDGEGKVVTGTFTIASELSTQNDLIVQIQNVVNSLPDAGGSGTGNYMNLYLNTEGNFEFIINDVCCTTCKTVIVPCSLSVASFILYNFDE